MVYYCSHVPNVTRRVLSETADEVDVDECLCDPAGGIGARNGKRTAENGSEGKGSDVFVHRDWEVSRDKFKDMEGQLGTNNGLMAKHLADG